VLSVYDLGCHDEWWCTVHGLSGFSFRSGIGLRGKTRQSLLVLCHILHLVADPVAVFGTTINR